MRVVLVEPEHEGNIGSIARAMKNFELEDLWLVKPKVELGIEAKAYAVNGAEIVSSAHVVTSLNQALRNVDLVVGTTAKTGWSTRNVLRTLVYPESFAEQVSATIGRVALLFGRESKGLSNHELDRCDLLVTIPTSPDYHTLNVAAAATILFYELYKHRLGKRSTTKTQAGGPALRTLEEYFGEICMGLELTPHKEELTLRAFRNILHRSYISQREASLLIGALRRASRRLRTEG